jgi:hypothetical protein
MEMFAAAYLVALVAIVLYVARLGAEQQRIRRTLESLQSQHENADSVGPPASKAA